jgi:uncharacterized protein (TIGR00369 family)
VERLAEQESFDLKGVREMALPIPSNDNGFPRDLPVRRPGPFRDAVEGPVPLHPAAATLGFELIEADAENGMIEVAFVATEDFIAPRGNVLGGFLAAMLYETVGAALLATLEPDEFEFISTLDMKTKFMRPAVPGRIVGRGRVVHRARRHRHPRRPAVERRRRGRCHGLRDSTCDPFRAARTPVIAARQWLPPQAALTTRGRDTGSSSPMDA